jgi:HPt (histidine-containing phosphotransfer) domain-containing protein
MARVPVVALTADAFADTRQRVLEAGMNNFLSKPVQVDDIEALLAAMFGARAQARPADAADFEDSGLSPWLQDTTATDTAPPSVTTALLPPTSAPAQAAEPAGAPAGARRRFRTSDVAAHLDMGVIGDVCVGVTLAGYQSVLIGFLDDEAGSSANLLAALDKGDSAALKRLAHTVKGASASMGLRAINAMAVQIESEGAGFSQSDCEGAAEHLRDLLGTAKALLQRMGFIRPPL